MIVVHGCFWNTHRIPTIINVTRTAPATSPMTMYLKIWMGPFRELYFKIFFVWAGTKHWRIYCCVKSIYCLLKVYSQILSNVNLLWFTDLISASTTIAAEESSSRGRWQPTISWDPSPEPMTTSPPSWNCSKIILWRYGILLYIC